MSKIDELLEERINAGREYRNTSSIEVRMIEEGEEEDKIVEGYAATFNQPYTLFDFGDYCVREQIDTHAFDECDMSDVIMQYDHEGRVFARMANKTLEVSADEHGLKMSANLGGTEIGRQLYEEIKGGYTNKMSFGFIVAEDKREIVEDYENNRTEVLRTITKIQKLFDVSAVSLPANDATEISARNFSNGVIEEVKAERLEAEKRKKQKQRIRILMEA